MTDICGLPMYPDGPICLQEFAHADEVHYASNDGLQWTYTACWRRIFHGTARCTRPVHHREPCVGTVAVDFDRTLHPYSNGWTGSEPDDEPPLPGAEEFLLGLLRDGYDVAIFSCRADHLDGEQGIIRWLHKHMPSIFYAMRDERRVTVTHVKPPAIAYVDDRAVTFAGDYNAVRVQIDVFAAGRQHGASAC